MDATVVWWL